MREQPWNCLVTDGACVLQTRSIEISPGRFLSIHSSGEGHPVVVFESGLLADSHEWEPVACLLNDPVCWYDRAGRGSSSPGPMPRTAQNCAEDLHRLLSSTGMPGPFLLAAHSIGGFIIRAFAAAHPGLVRGIILAEASHQDQFDRIGSVFQRCAPLKSPEQEALRQFWTDGWRDPGGNAEGFDFPATFRQMSLLPSLEDLPLTVISAASTWENLEVPAKVREELNRISAELQLDLLGLSSRAHHIVVPGSGHFIQRDAPAVIAKVVHQYLRN